MRYRLAILLISGLLILSALEFGCSPSNVNSSSAGLPVVGNNSTASALALTATTNPIAPGASTTVTARVVDSLGNNVSDGTVVNFSFAPGDQVKASLSGSSATTVNGLATVTVAATSQTSAVAVINASSGAATGNISITISTSGGGGGGGGGSIQLTASPTILTAGGSGSTVTATVKDASGNAVANTAVNFTSSSVAGTLSSSTAQTDTSGVATVTLTPVTAGLITLTATVSSMPGVQGTVSVTINPASLVPAIAVIAAPSTILTNGLSSISVIVSGQSVTVSGQTIDFTVSNPAVATFSGLSATSAVTNGSGIATVTINALNVSSPVTVTASCAALVLSGSTTVTITAPPPDTVVVLSNPASITVYGTTTISALITGASKSIPDGTFVNFILNDSSYGSLSTTSGSTVNGKATTAFVSTGKAGSVSIGAVAGTVSNSTTISISPAETGSIQFVSAVPQVIGIKSSGSPETGIITFAVKDINGMPVVDGTSVNFSMLGPGGGAYIGSVIGSTTASSGTVGGNASVILHSGTTAGPVTIIASTAVAGGATISTSANQISIGGGVPSETHWNLTTSQWNLSGLAFSGKTADIEVWIADRFGNYNILKGTTISFYTEAGAIDRQGLTDVKGLAKAILRTQAPAPADVKNTVFTPVADSDSLDFIQVGFSHNEPWYSGSVTAAHPSTGYNPRDGWVTVLATTMGEEAFIDENGNGLFTASYSNSTVCPPSYTCQCDNGACITSQYNGGAGPCTRVSPLTATPATCAAVGGNYRSEGFIDIGEPFYDVNDNGKRDAGMTSGYPFEQFIDSQLNGTYDDLNGKWDGPDCQTAGCLKSKMIWKDIRLVFSGHPYFYPVADVITNNYGLNPYVPAGSGFSSGVSTLMVGDNATFSVIVGDENLNTLEPGTTITASVSDPAKIIGPSSYTIPDGLSYGPSGLSFAVVLADPGEANGTGKYYPVSSFNVSVAVETPSKLVGGVSTSVDITYPLMSIAPTSLPAGTFTGTPAGYSVALRALGSRGPASWSVSAGALPPGLSIDTFGGSISGTPQAAGTYAFTVQVVDGLGRYATAALSILIN